MPFFIGYIMNKKKLIIFDMDGTLIDSGNVITNTINFVRNNIGLDSIPKKEMLTQLNNPDINASDLVVIDSNTTGEINASAISNITGSIDNLKAVYDSGSANISGLGDENLTLTNTNAQASDEPKMRAHFWENSAICPTSLA